MHSAVRPIAVAVLTTAVVAALSYTLPDRYAATGVGLAFLAATYLMVLRGDEAKVPRFGLSLGGLLESQPLVPRRLVKDGATALAWASGFAVAIFPFFWFGFKVFWGSMRHIKPFTWVPPESFSDELLGQLLVIALPEEAFYRGYLQTALDEAWPKRKSIFGAQIGWGLLVTSVLFAVGHYITVRDPNRLAVFFPSLVFGWLRARTGGVGAPIAFHAMSNIFSAMLGRGYGLHP